MEAFQTSMEDCFGKFRRNMREKMKAKGLVCAVLLVLVAGAFPSVVHAQVKSSIAIAASVPFDGKWESPISGSVGVALTGPVSGKLKWYEETSIGGSLAVFRPVFGIQGGPVYGIGKIAFSVQGLYRLALNEGLVHRIGVVAGCSVPVLDSRGRTGPSVMWSTQLGKSNSGSIGVGWKVWLMF